MLRRLPAAALLLTLLLRGAASLHACESARAAGEAPPAPTAVARATHAEHGSPEGHARVCDRRHAGRCPHAGGAALHRCETDPAAGLAAAAEPALPVVRSVETLAPARAVSPPLAGESAAGIVPPPEAPPPRSLV